MAPIRGQAVYGQVDDTATQVPAEDATGIARITPQRALHANLRNVAGTEVGTVTAPLRTDPSGTTTQPVSAPVGTPVAVRVSDGAAFIDPRDVSDRAARLLGKADVLVAAAAPSATNPLAVRPTDGTTFIDPRDVSDRAGRILGQVTNAGTFVVQDSDKIVDNLAFTDGATKLFVTGYIFDEVAGTALTENDAAAPRIDAKRATVGVIEDATTRGQRAAVTAANALKVDGSAVTQPVSIAATVTTTPATRNTYTALYRLASRPYALSSAFGAAGTRQYATIYHDAASTKTVQLLSVRVAIESASAAAIVTANLIKLSATTAPAAGNPAITPILHQGAGSAAEAVCLALPTTEGSALATRETAEWNLGITGAGATTNPPPPLQWVELLPTPIGSFFAPYEMALGVANGFAVVIDVSAAATVKCLISIVFTEI